MSDNLHRYSDTSQSDTLPLAFYPHVSSCAATSARTQLEVENLFQNIFERELRYAINLCRRNNFTLLTPADVVMEALTERGFCRKRMRDMVLTEKRRNKTSKTTEKRCTCCNEIKTANEFYFRVDYRMNYRYLMQPCKQCFKVNYNIKQMKLYALLPNDYLREARESILNFKAECSLGKNAAGETTLILTVKDAKGKAINGTQFIADLERSKNILKKALTDKANGKK